MTDITSKVCRNTLRKVFRYVIIVSLDGRSIPSFRQLLQIEKLNWSFFKKKLPTKKDKQEFDKVFDNVALYAAYLGKASNHIPLESVFMGAVFHNYKQLLQITKEDDITINVESLKDDLESLLETLRKQNPVLPVQ